MRYQKKHNLFLLSLFVLLFFLIGCASTGGYSSGTGKDERGVLKARYLRDITQGEYFHYRQYLDEGAAYVIVHPGYYQFFHRKMEKMKDESPLVHKYMLTQLKEEERFLRELSKERKLIVMVLPGKKHPQEYINYLNENISGGDSVIYLQSIKTNSGKLSPADRKRLSEFFERIGVRQVIVGGGYVGRCQEKVYTTLLKELGEDKVAIAPEISSISPNDLSDATVKMFTSADGTPDFRVISAFIRNGGAKTLNKRANIRNLNNRTNQQL
jgi:hypothetical protein